MNSRRVLVTGAAGFIGRHLCDFLLERGYIVFGTTRSGIPSGLNSIKWFKMDDIETVDWSPLLKEVDYVVHCAALAHQVETQASPQNYQRINHHGTARLAQAIACSPV